MREIHDHKVNPANDKLDITVLDEPGPGGANHEYQVTGYASKDGVHNGCLRISFQEGPIAEAGVNGVTQEVLIAIVIDRLRSFQQGKFACRENALALTKLEEAQLWLFSRTLKRMQRGVEGTNVA